jgi:hypothetical protein
LTVIWERALRLLPGDTRVIGYCAVFKVREEVSLAVRGPGSGPVSRRRRAGLSKLNSMRAASTRNESSPCGLPGPVDIPRADRARGERRGARELKRRSSSQPVPLRAP